MTRLPELEHELVTAAARLGRRRRRISPRTRIGVLAAAVVAAVAVALAGAGLTGERDDERPARPPPDAPPRMEADPVPGSLSEPLAFTVAGVRYRAVGFRDRRSLICVALTEVDAGLPAGQSCLRDRPLRRRLQREPALLSGGGGLRRGGLVHSGFARAQVTDVSPVGQAEDLTVILSRPWRPEPWTGKGIRFVLVFDPRGSARPGRTIPLVAVLNTGGSIQVP